MLRIGQGGALLPMERRAFDHGRDRADRKMRPYTPEYAERKGSPRSPVDLTRTGTMRRSLRVDVDRRRDGDHVATIDLRARGVPPYAVHTNRDRAWFGLSRSDAVVLRRVFAREVRRAIERGRARR